MTVPELTTLLTVWEVERTQLLLTILTMSVKNPQLASFLLTQNRSNFYKSKAQLRGSMIVSPPYIADRRYGTISVNYLDTVMYDDPNTRQTFESADQIPCENNPHNVISLDTGTDQYYVLTPHSLLGKIIHYLSNLHKSTQLLAKHLHCPRCRFFSNRNLNIFGTVFFLPNIPIIHYKLLAKIIVMKSWENNLLNYS